MAFKIDTHRHLSKLLVHQTHYRGWENGRRQDTNSTGKIKQQSNEQLYTVWFLWLFLVMQKLIDQLYSINPDIAKKIEERGFKAEDRAIENERSL